MGGTVAQLLKYAQKAVNLVKSEASKATKAKAEAKTKAKVKVKAKANNSLTLFPAGLLLVDEGSQLNFPSLLALTSLLAAPPCPATVLVAGDHRQLAAINAHDFGAEARPSVVAMGTHLSAYDYLLQLSKGGRAVGCACEGRT